MPVLQAPLTAVIPVDIRAKGADPNSIYVDSRPAAGGQNEGSFRLGDNPEVARWLNDLVAWVNLALAPTDVTCGAITESVSDWICGLWADDQALQTAVIDLQIDVTALEAVQFWADDGFGNIANTNPGIVDLYGGTAVNDALSINTDNVYAALAVEDPGSPTGAYIVEADSGGYLEYYPYSVNQILADIAAVGPQNFWYYLTADPADGIGNNAAPITITGTVDITETLYVAGDIGTAATVTANAVAANIFSCADGEGIFSASGSGIGIEPDIVFWSGGGGTPYQTGYFLDASTLTASAAGYIGDTNLGVTTAYRDAIDNLQSTKQQVSWIDFSQFADFAALQASGLGFLYVQDLTGT